jgi:hypothetical protein
LCVLQISNGITIDFFIALQLNLQIDFEEESLHKVLFEMKITLYIILLFNTAIYFMNIFHQKKKIHK